MIIWIASYPKCGNTWVRAFLSAYYYSSTGKFNFELLKKIKQFPTREFFGRKFKSVDEVADNWLKPQKIIKEKKELCFLKTHNVYGAFKGKNFTTPEYTLGVINIVRDPRNVITSLMNHYTLSETDALNMISSIYRNLRDENDLEDFSNYSFISSWANNYNSWHNSKIKNKLLIKYEELEKETEKNFIKIVEFVNKLIGKNNKVDLEKLRTSIKTTEFEVLKRQEISKGFFEAVTDKNGNKKIFFNLGNKNNFEKILEKKTIDHIENSFKNEMRELGYLK